MYDVDIRCLWVQSEFKWRRIFVVWMTKKGNLNWYLISILATWGRCQTHLCRSTILSSLLLSCRARFITVAIPISILKYKNAFERNAIPILIWGGFRGGISVALALSFPATMFWRSVRPDYLHYRIIFDKSAGLTIGKFVRIAGIDSGH